MAAIIHINIIANPKQLLTSVAKDSSEDLSCSQIVLKYAVDPKESTVLVVNAKM